MTILIRNQNKTENQNQIQNLKNRISIFWIFLVMQPKNLSANCRGPRGSHI